MTTMHTGSDLHARFRTQENTAPLDLQRVAAHLAGCGMHLDLAAGARQFAGGLANINYLLRVDGEPAVLRRPPDGPLPPGAHDMAREHRILSRLWRALPLAPRGLLLCEDADVIGVPFQIMEFRDGLVIAGDDDSAFRGRPERATAMARTLVETLVQVHQVDVAQVGLADLGRPEGFVARGIAGWRRRAERLDLDADAQALVDEVGRWLAAQTVRPRSPVLLHCDFKLDNLILDPDTLAPRAIVDWDMGTRGDPLFDVATLLSYWSEVGDPGCMQRLAQMPTASPGFPSRVEMLQRYARATGTDVSDFQVLRVLGMFKLAVVFLQLHALHVSGVRVDARSSSFGVLGGELLEFTLDVARGNAT
jgi:aminoglycoside phosphotransferase (APT) family kinase protein